MSALKGQNLRVFVGGNVVAEATSCTITLTNNTEEVSTKGDTGLASRPQTTTKSWQVQVDSMYIDDIISFLNAIKSGTAFTLKWDKTSGDNNAAAQNANLKRSGSALLTDATFVFEDRKYSTKQLTFTGSGAIS